MKECILFCRKDNFYRNFYPSAMVVSMAGATPDEIRKVKVTESEDGGYWAWWDNGTGMFSSQGERFTHVYPKRFLVEICSPDGFKKAIERGEGNIVQVKVEEISDG
jgi:hypothetical protein